MKEETEKWATMKTMKMTAKILFFLMLLLNPEVEKVNGMTMGNALLRAKIAIANIKVRKQDIFHLLYVSDPITKREMRKIFEIKCGSLCALSLSKSFHIQSGGGTQEVRLPPPL